MVLSNPVKIFAPVLLVVLLLSACSRGHEDDDIPSPPVAEVQSDIPFSAKEPVEFEAEIVVTSDLHTTLSYYARKGGRWRYDFFVGDRRFSIVQAETLYSIDHERKLYAEGTAGNGLQNEPEFVNDMTFGLLKRRIYSSYEKLAAEGDVTKYRVTAGDSAGAETVIHYDESLGLIVKQEFGRTSSDTDAIPTAMLTFELKNIRLEVHDSVFELDAGYKKVALPELQKGFAR
jgi:hypothetical protein